MRPRQSRPAPQDPAKADPPRAGGTPVKGKNPFPAHVRERSWGPGHFKIEMLLTAEHLREFDGLLRRHATRDVLREWLHERGYKVGNTAIANYARNFSERLRVATEAAEMSYACAELARQVGRGFLTDGAMTRFEVLLTKALFALKADGTIEPELWETLGKALSNAVGNRQKVEALRRTIDEEKRKSAAPGAPGDEPDGKTVVERVKEILGV